MVQLARVLEEKKGSDAVDHRVRRLKSVLTRSEKLARVALSKYREGKAGEARAFRKRAHDEARMAMRLIGILHIEFNVEAARVVSRIRSVLKVIRAINGNGKKVNNDDRTGNSV